MDLHNLLPQTFSNPSRIFINPNFNKPQAAHINPNFLVPKSAPSTIHLNPNFLQMQVVETQHCPPAVIPSSIPSCSIDSIGKSKVELNRILSKSRTKIVREPMPKPSSSAPNNSTGSLVKIGLRKLVRGSAVSLSEVSSFKPKTLPHKHSSSIFHSICDSKYKIDRRKEPLFRKVINKYRRKSFVGQYALRRCADVSPTKKLKPPIVKRFGTKAAYNKQNVLHCQNKLQIIDINGVRYKSTKNKLQRNDTSSTRSSSISQRPVHKTGERTLIVRGNKFILDKHGFKITRANPTTMHAQKKPSGVCLMKRIDLGGLTYIAKSNNLFVRTGYHLIRNHVSAAKQKSIYMLSRNLVKSNVPCAIYQRVGKCAAFERGKCMKVHDKMQISICQRFLRGECSQADCLLSHHVSLSKMPVCKFFLQGCCIRSDCPYLHKKLSQRTEICAEFVKGFCLLADQCNKRHEFLCPDFESKGKCERVKCIFCKRKKQQQQRSIDEKPDKILLQLKTCTEDRQSKYEEISEPTDNSVPQSSNSRYFVKDSEDLENEDIPIDKNEKIETHCEMDVCTKDDVSSNAQLLKPSRLKLGDLPAFIPFS